MSSHPKRLLLGAAGLALLLFAAVATAGVDRNTSRAEVSGSLRVVSNWTGSEGEAFQARISFDPDPIHRRPDFLKKMGGMATLHEPDPAYRCAAVSIGFQVRGESRIWGREIYLPLSLPDDRRARTRVEVLP